jgi:uncharacterized protein YdaU (DUF1376 family)
MSKTTFELPWYYRQVPRDFMSSPDVTMMTAEEIGAYFLLLQCAWLGGQDCTLPNDADRLAKLARVPKVSEIVLSKFQLDEKGRLFNPRLMDEWNQAVKRSNDAKKAISTRWEKNIRSNNDRNTTVEPPNDGRITTNYLIPTTKTKTKTSRQAQVVRSTASDEASGSASSEPSGPSDSAGRVTAKLAEVLGRENLKPATVKAWAELADNILTKYPEPEVLAVMQWALVESDNMFWRGRVYSMKHFANFFATLHQQYKIRAAGKRAADPLAARAASLQTGHDFSAIAKGDV